MIRPLPGWSFARTEDRVVMRLRDAPEDCTITYVERVRPLASPVIAAQAVPWPAGAEVSPPAPPRALVTVEGEHAALVVLHGRVGRLAVKRVVGVVLVDDFYGCVVGGTHVPSRHDELEAAVERLTIEDRHFFGERRRSYLHDAPAGWSARNDGSYQVRYRSPDGATTIIVYPAVPHGGDGEAAEQVLATHLEAPQAALVASEASPVTAASGLTGRAWSLSGHLGDARVAGELVVFEDDRYVYSLAAMGRADEGANVRAAVAKVAATVQPIPRRHALAARNVSLFQFWNE